MAVLTVSEPTGTDGAARTVTVEPAGVTFEVRPGQSVIQAAWQAGYHWPTTCWGQAECGACAMEVVAGSERLSPVGAAEALRLRALGRRGTGRRLACQAHCALEGPVVVKKPGVRPR